MLYNVGSAEAASAERLQRSPTATTQRARREPGRRARSDRPTPANTAVPNTNTGITMVRSPAGRLARPGTTARITSAHATTGTARARVASRIRRA